MNPKIYIDVDGVLFGRYGTEGRIQLRPNAMGFLFWCTENFECNWLTGWRIEDIDRLLIALYCRTLIDHISYTDWKRNGSKGRSINMHEDFYWIEDGISEADMKLLADAGRVDRYIPCEFCGESQLYVAQIQLQQILDERKEGRSK